MIRIDGDGMKRVSGIREGVEWGADGIGITAGGGLEEAELRVVRMLLLGMEMRRGSSGTGGRVQQKVGVLVREGGWTRGRSVQQGVGIVVGGVVRRARGHVGLGVAAARGLLDVRREGGEGGSWMVRLRRGLGEVLRKVVVLLVLVLWVVVKLGCGRNGRERGRRWGSGEVGSERKVCDVEIGGDGGGDRRNVKGNVGGEVIGGMLGWENDSRMVGRIGGGERRDGVGGGGGRGGGEVVEDQVPLCERGGGEKVVYGVHCVDWGAGVGGEWREGWGEGGGIRRGRQLKEEEGGWRTRRDLQRERGRGGVCSEREIGRGGYELREEMT